MLRKTRRRPFRRALTENGEFENWDEMWAAVGPSFKERVDSIARYLYQELNDASEAVEMDYGVFIKPDSTADEMEEGSYWYNIQFENKDGEELPMIDVQFEVVDSEEYDGLDDDGSWMGANVSVSITGEGGEMYGGLTPYNYSDRVWTKDPAELEERMDMLDMHELAAYLLDEVLPEHLRDI